MFTVGGSFKALNMSPIGLSAFSNERRLGETGNGRSVNQDSRFDGLREAAEELWKAASHRSIASVCDELAGRSLCHHQTVRKRIKKLDAEQPLIPAGSGRNGRPRKPTKS